MKNPPNKFNNNKHDNTLESMSENGKLQGVMPVTGMYKNWFLDYASYVIMDRAVPALEDGLKPVQRRILHALKEMDDGRYHKVANAIGQTMQFHPHGDASIYEALVNIGQKDLMIDTQGNWGDFRTGDTAAAARYIEARLSKFALEVAFNKENTEWQLSYDGRKQEPITLPMKFPLLLVQGVEGIAVGLSTKVMPHNFIEIIKASIQILKGKTPEIYPDFLTGGMVDVTNYNGGKRGGKIRVRAEIEVKDKKTLLIKSIPYGTTTTNLIESIVKANDKSKIKIKKVTDNTAKDVEIQIDLAPGVSPDVTVDALFAFTNCEVSISPNCCIIYEDKPQFISVNDLLRISTEHTRQLLKSELEIKLAALLEKLHFASLEQIFIEKRVYRRIEECETFEAVIEAIDKGLKPHIKHFIREITEEDILRLTEIKIKRISKYDSFKANDAIKRLEEAIAEIEHHLANLTAYAITYFNDLLKKYGKGRERKTEIRNFDTIEAAQVAVANEKLYINRADGFIGYGLKKDEFVSECSDIDDIIVFRKDGKCMVTRVADKVFVGKDVIHVAVWKKGDERRIYHLAYWDGNTERAYVKRFSITAVTRDREYNLLTDHPKSKLLYFEYHPNGESEVIQVLLSPRSKAKVKKFEFDFSDLAVKGRTARGNILSRHPVRKITQVSVGASTMGGIKVWLDETVGKLNNDARGRLLGEFDTGDSILALYNNGSYEMTDFEPTNRFDMKEVAHIVKFDPEMIIAAIHYHTKKKAYYVKRFKIETSTLGQKFFYINEDRGSKLLHVTISPEPVLDYTIQIKRQRHNRTLFVNQFMDIKGWRALGNKLTDDRIVSVKEVMPKTPVKPKTSAKPTAKKTKGSKGGNGAIKQGELFT